MGHNVTISLYTVSNPLLERLELAILLLQLKVHLCHNFYSAFLSFVSSQFSPGSFTCVKPSSVYKTRCARLCNRKGQSVCPTTLMQWAKILQITPYSSHQPPLPPPVSPFPAPSPFFLQVVPKHWFPPQSKEVFSGKRSAGESHTSRRVYLSRERQMGRGTDFRG